MREYGIFLLLGILFSMPVTAFLQKKSENNTSITNIASVVTPVVYGLAFLWALSFALMGYHNPFMYQQF